MGDLEDSGYNRLDLDPVTKNMWEEYLDSVFKYTDDPTSENKGTTRSLFEKFLHALRANGD